VRWLTANGARTFIEIGPDAALSAAGQACAADSQPVFAPLARAGQAEVRTLVTAVARAAANGATPDWRAFYGPGARRTELPTYQFQRAWYWTQNRSAQEPAASVVDSWRYRIDWQPVSQAASATLSGTWLVIVPGHHDGDGRIGAVLRGLAGHGAFVETLAVTDPDRAALTARLRQAGDAAGGVLSLLALDERPSPGHPALARGYLATVALAQAAADAGHLARLWCVTAGAVSVAEDECPRPGQATIWGLGIGLSLDCPHGWGGLIDLPDTVDTGIVRALCATLAAGGAEDQVVLRPTGTFARRMVRAPLGTAAPASPWRPRGTTLITGGTGGLGARVARLAADRGASHILLASRRGLAASGAERLAADLAARGARVTVAACDVSDRDALGRLLAAIPPDAPLTAVFHAAGRRQRLAPLADLTIAEVAEVAQAKVAGAAHLDDLLADMPLDAFVLFSSGAAAWGSAGQAAYAAANAYLDALALQRRARDRPATSIAWGSWDSGMVDADLAAGLRRIGTPPIQPSLGATALRQVLDHGQTSVVIADIDWARFAPIYTMARPRPLLDALPEVREALAGGIGQGTPGQPDAAARFAAMPAAQRQHALLDLVRAEVSVLLGYGEHDVLDLGRPFADLGFDSVAVTDLMSRLSIATGRKLPSTLVFDSVNPAALAERLQAQVAPADDVQAVLDRLEETVATLSSQEAERHQVASRLQALLTVVGPAGTGVAHAGTAGLPDPAATAEEVFDFIDKELGVG
jgi:NAD(P)-dependent dehydrogenase (short-subunit alcohol dehydrogenase family)